jgi:hypothetical protein
MISSTKSLILLVGAGGFELPTPSPQALDKGVSCRIGFCPGRQKDRGPRFQASSSLVRLALLRQIDSGGANGLASEGRI